MICDAPPADLKPPTWTMQVAGSADPRLMLGFTTNGTQPQLETLASAVQSQALHCELQQAPDGALRLLVMFDSATTRDTAYATYNRVAKGEFGTGKTNLIIVPANEGKGR